MSNRALSPQAKEVMRIYMIKIIKIPGGILAIQRYLIGLFEQASQLILAPISFDKTNVKLTGHFEATGNRVKIKNKGDI